MKLLHRMLVRQFFPAFLFALLFFVMGLQLFDIFQNLYTYMNNDVPGAMVMRIMLLYMPRCISFSIPMALLFAVSYSLGMLYANNELIAIFGSGISLFSFVVPLIFLACFFSLGSFFFDDQIVIPTLLQKNELVTQVSNKNNTASRTNPSVLDLPKNTVYHADYYNDATQTLSHPIIVKTDVNGHLLMRLNADSAVWDPEGSEWIFQHARIFTWSGPGVMTEEFSQEVRSPEFNLPPISFKKNKRDVSEMSLDEMQEWIETLRSSGQTEEYRAALSEYHERFSYALTPFIVVFISSAIGGRFKKNILLMSLLSSLSVAVIYYVIQMVFVLFGELGYIPPVVGAWTSFIVMSIIGIYLFYIART